MVQTVHSGPLEVGRREAWGKKSGGGRGGGREKKGMKEKYSPRGSASVYGLVNWSTQTLHPDSSRHGLSRSFI